ncbi:MAG: DUF3450 domain-containing protein [Myxococcota bacterium]|jgi:hypothetical protein|nr:DUF3450 domain-containing protein [Myxococcota bacterium]
MKELRKSKKWSRVSQGALFAVGLVVILSIGASASGEDSAAMASQISRLRIEVEELAADVEAKKDEARGRLRSYATQQTELEMDLQREELRLRQLLAEREKRTELVGQGDQRETQLRPVVLAGIEAVRHAMADGLPFQVEERLAEVDKLREQIEQGMLRPSDGVSRLWDRVEDELRLSRENGIYRQIVTVNGRETLVDVARVGMVALYFRTKDDFYGKALQRGGKWTYELLPDPKDKERVALLFDSFKKQIRTGFFLLPSALPEGR